MGRPATIWIASLGISDRTKQKLWGKHHVDPWEVTQEVECRSGLPFSWDYDDERGLRAFVYITIRGAAWTVVLYPQWDVGADVEDLTDPHLDFWNLGTCLKE